MVYLDLALDLALEKLEAGQIIGIIILTGFALAAIVLCVWCIYRAQGITSSKSARDSRIQGYNQTEPATDSDGGPGVSSNNIESLKSSQSSTSQNAYRVGNGRGSIKAQGKGKFRGQPSTEGFRDTENGNFTTTSNGVNINTSSNAKGYGTMQSGIFESGYLVGRGESADIGSIGAKELMRDLEQVTAEEIAPMRIKDDTQDYGDQMDDYEIYDPAVMNDGMTMGDTPESAAEAGYMEYPESYMEDGGEENSSDEDYYDDVQQDVEIQAPKMVGKMSNHHDVSGTTPTKGKGKQHHSHSRHDAHQYNQIRYGEQKKKHN